MIDSKLLTAIGLLTIAVIPALMVNSLGPETDMMVRCFYMVVELGALGVGGYYLVEHLAEQNRTRRK